MTDGSRKAGEVSLADDFAARTRGLVKDVPQAERGRSHRLLPEMTVATLRRQSWFEDRNYLLIYWHRFFFVLAESGFATGGSLTEFTVMLTVAVPLSTCPSLALNVKLSVPL